MDAAGDLGLVLTGQAQTLDLAVVDGDLLADHTLRTAVLLSLFVETRVDGERGWWGDEFLRIPGDSYGSKLWRLERSKMVPDLAILARQYTREALAWLVADGVAEKTDVIAEQTRDSLFVRVDVFRPNKQTPTTFKFQHVWGEAGWRELDGV